jgi:hypothetical protein
VGTDVLGCPGERSSPGFPLQRFQSEIGKEFIGLPNPFALQLLLDFKHSGASLADSRGRLSPHRALCHRFLSRTASALSMLCLGE